jgi:predicted ATPase
MLTELRIKNFKAWKDTGAVRMAPLTVIFGANSSGKSSLGHLLLALKQTTLLSDRKRALHLGDETTLIDLGTFSDCIFGHDLKSNLEFSLSWQPPSPIVVRNSLVRGDAYTGNTLKLRSTIRVGRGDQPEVSSISYELSQDKNIVLTANHGRSETNSVTLDTAPLKLVKATGRVWPLEPPEKFYRFSDRTLARFQNADFLASFALETERVLGNLYYLGPLRSPPRRIYQWSGDIPSDVGSSGEFSVPAMLAADSEGRRLNRRAKQPLLAFGAFIAKWLKDLGVINSFEVRPVAKGRKEFEVLVKTSAGSPDVKLTDVGFGVSQVLPALVESFYAPPNSIVWMEQPEIHLHPQVQAELADVFISATQARESGKPRNVQLIIESHSEHLLTRLQRRVAEGLVNPDSVAVYFCRHGRESAELEPLRMNLYGDIENWPENFFGNETADVHARTVSAMQRKIRERERESSST